jgi:hypothetical protein
MSIPTVEEVERIAAISDPVIRNLNITQCYYEISQAMVCLTGVSPNWCTFAVWASKQAGQSIRKEDLIRTFEYYFCHSPEVKFVLENITQYFKNLPEIKTVRDSILEVIDPEAVFNKSGEAVANGNRKVFEEIGRVFARFLSLFRNEEDFTGDNIIEFCSALRTGDPPEGQQLLKNAFTAYYEAKQLSDPKLKAEMFHYANLLIGFHEQTRLQPEIIEALNSFLGDTDKLRYKIFKQFLPGFWLRIRYFISRLFGLKLPLDELLDQILDLVKRQVREVITRNLMSLYVPECAVIRLGSNLQIDFPPVLQKISYQKLTELLIKVDPTTDSLEESGAEDWGDLADRIHFIADFFRCFYDHHPLFNSPFTEEQVSILKSGHLPSGTL